MLVPAKACNGLSDLTTEAQALESQALGMKWVLKKWKWIWPLSWNSLNQNQDGATDEALVSLLLR